MAQQKTYDAIIIGSGASGGMAAKELTEKGLEVLVLEAGPPVNPARDLSNHDWPLAKCLSQHRPAQLAAERTMDAGDGKPLQPAFLRQRF